MHFNCSNRIKLATAATLTFWQRLLLASLGKYLQGVKVAGSTAASQEKYYRYLPREASLNG